MGDVIGDLNSRRGHIEGMDNRAGTQVVRAFVPLASMFGYVTDLRSMTQGRASSSMEFSHYAELPRKHRGRAGPAGAGVLAGRPVRGPHHQRHTSRRRDSSSRGTSADGQEEVRAHQAPRQRGHHRAHRPRQDVADRGHHQVPGAQGRARSTAPSTPSTTRPRSASGASPSPSPTSSTRPTPATTPTSTARGTRTTSRT